MNVLVTWKEFSAMVLQKSWYIEASVSRKGMSLMTRNEMNGTLYI